ncbi:MAG: glycerol-3-phosphate acyltransferase, partial [Dehalococcoidales bacterium]|nr:glycerol-3-phosphate acyltransferase [Dehalococcoidales bacterium]
GIAAVLGHNWSVFLKFSGGRGLWTSAGLILFVPLINGLVPWGVITFVAIALSGLIIWHSSPLPALLGVAGAPVTTALTSQPTALSLGFLVLLLIMVIKRLQPSTLPETMQNKKLLLNRLLFDRDIRDRKVWMYRKPADERKQEGDLS